MAPLMPSRLTESVTVMRLKPTQYSCCAREPALVLEDVVGAGLLTAAAETGKRPRPAIASREPRHVTSPPRAVP